MTPSITVAICSLNGARRLPETLRALYSQISPETDVLVVDDGSTDSTCEVAKSFGARTVRHERNLGYGHARQTALENCHTDILAFIDDECVIANDWFQTLLLDWSNMGPGVVSLAGPILLLNDGLASAFLSRNNPFTPVRSFNHAPKILFQRITRYLWPKYDMSSGFVESAGNGNLSFRRVDLEKIGGYQVNMNLGNEDEDVCKRLRERFGRECIWFDSELRVDHASVNTWRSVLARSFKYGRTSAIDWRLSGGVPTYLPIPIIFLMVSAIAYVFLSWKTSMLVILGAFVFLNIPHVRRSGVSVTSIVLDPVFRIVIELFHNVGFVWTLVPHSCRQDVVHVELSNPN